MHSIRTESLVKEFAGGVRAVDGITFDVEEGEIFGFLGPNGAGKSTTMMILTTLLKPTSGRAVVSGMDVAADPGGVRRCIGYVQQESASDEFLTGRENLMLQARMNRMPRGSAASRIDEVIGIIELDGMQDEAVLTYSGGMRKRLDIAGGLLHMPRILFLDEPTVGLDIQTRRKIWEYIRRLHDEYGMSIFVSTHYMEEADRLCDEVAIIDHGKIQAIDTPSSMKASLGDEAVTLTVAGWSSGGGEGGAAAARARLAEAAGAIAGVKGVSLHDDGEGRGGERRMTVFASDAARTLARVFEAAAAAGVSIGSVSLARPTLDDVFIAYTGRDLRDGTPGSGGRNRDGRGTFGAGTPPPRPRGRGS